MAIYVDTMSAPTAGGGIQTFIDTLSWELVTTGVDDFYQPVADHQSLRRVIKEWLADPENMTYSGKDLAYLLLSQVSEDRIPTGLLALAKEASLASG